MTALDPDILIETAQQLVRSDDLLGREWEPAFRVLVESLAREAGLRDPAGVAKTLALLLEGAIVTAQVAGDPGAARTAKRAAKVIVDAAT